MAPPPPLLLLLVPELLVPLPAPVTTGGGGPTGCSGRSSLELVPLVTSATCAGDETTQPSGAPPLLGAHTWGKQRSGVAVALGVAVPVALVVALGVSDALVVAVALPVGDALTDALPELERVCVGVALTEREGDGVTWQ